MSGRLARTGFQRRLQNRAANTTCTVERNTPTTNELREVVPGYAPVETDLPVEFNELDGDELIIAQRVDVRISARVILAVNVLLERVLTPQLDDVLVIEHLGGAQRWAVTFIHPLSQTSTGLQIDLRREEGQ